MPNVARHYGCLVLALALVACAQPPPPPAAPPDTRAADEAAIRAAIKDWAAAAAAKDAGKFASFYAEDAVLMFAGAPDVKGAPAIREGVAGLMKDPNFALSFEATSVQVARSGDIAYELGTYSMTTTDPKTKKPANEKGSYVVVWKRQADGQWKAVVDAPLSDPPA